MRPFHAQPGTAKGLSRSSVQFCDDHLHFLIYDLIYPTDNVRTADRKTVNVLVQGITCRSLCFLKGIGSVFWFLNPYSPRIIAD